MLRRWSIKKKLLGILTLTTCVGLLASGLVIITFDFISFKRQRINELRTQAEMLGEISSAALSFDDPKAARDYLAALALRPTFQVGAIYDARGKLFATYHRGDSADASPLEPTFQGHRVEGEEVEVTRPIQRGQERIGKVYLRAELGLQERLKGYASLVLSVMVGSLGAALLISTRLQAQITEPLIEIAQAAHQVIDRQDYSPRVRKRSEDEVGLLVDAFNDMLGQIERREAALQHANQVLSKRTEDLARSNEDLERFAHIASHDLQEPLRMVSSYTQLLARRYKGKLDSDADEFIHYAVRGAQTMQALILDLLAYAQVGSKGREVTPTPLGEVVEKAQERLYVALQEAQATLVVGDLPTVSVDPGQFTQLFQNLLGNAVKFRGPHPLRIEIGATSDPQGWTLWVKDNGIGVDPQYKERIFILFQRLHTRDEFPGTGMGLSICKRIMERHGGRIWVDSRPGEGSTFYFTLPEVPPGLGPVAGGPP